MQWKCAKQCQKTSKMDAHSESRQRVFAAASVKFTAAKYILAAARTKFVAARIFRIKGLGVQPKTTRCTENTSRYSENTLS